MKLNPSIKNMSNEYIFFTDQTALTFRICLVFIIYFYHTHTEFELSFRGSWLSHSKQVLTEIAARRGSWLHLRICGQLQLSSSEYLSCWWRHSPDMHKRKSVHPASLLNHSATEFWKWISLNLHMTVSPFSQNCTYQNERNNTEFHLPMGDVGCYFRLPPLRGLKNQSKK